MGLGTVQFGVDYGITNPGGKIDGSYAKEILTVAASSGISLIDTAFSYGNSEKIIGQNQPKNNSFKIVTKLPTTTNPIINATFSRHLKLKFETSLANLKIKKTYGLLLHNVHDLLKPGGNYLVDVLEDIRADGGTEKIGISVYNEKEIDAILKIFSPDIIQVPLNILDQRLIKSKTIDNLKKLGIEIHARSLFLQGTLLAKSTNLSNYFTPALTYFKAIETTTRETGLTSLELCLMFGLQSPADFLIIGVTSLSEFNEIINSLLNLKTGRQIDFTGLAMDEEQFLNPSLWQT